MVKVEVGIGQHVSARALTSLSVCTLTSHRIWAPFPILVPKLGRQLFTLHPQDVVETGRSNCYILMT
jgi:hypothetical protein